MQKRDKLDVLYWKSKTKSVPGQQTLCITETLKDLSLRRCYAVFGGQELQRFGRTRLFVLLDDEDGGNTIASLLFPEIFAL